MEWGKFCRLTEETDKLYPNIEYMSCFVRDMNTRLSIIVIILLSGLILSACGNHVWHYVRKGDTLYSVSFRYGQDYQQVAKWNQIAPPYTISPGQRLRVSPPLDSDFSTVAAVPSSQGRDLDKTDNVDQGVNHQPTLSRVQPRPERQASITAAGIDARPAPPVYPDKIVWKWPARGKVIQSFSKKQPGPKGIDIAGRKGMPVRAAASGRVVYAGEGLASYGRLIIIKHNEKFLSAYAHNEKLLVKEGQNVEAGSVIAEMGASGTDRTKLHFEVREMGQPVNPLIYLPKH